MTPPDEARVIAGRLTKAQRAAVIDAVRLLDAFAGDGIGFDDGTTKLDSDDVVWALAEAFIPGWDGEMSVTDAVRTILTEDTSHAE